MTTSLEILNPLQSLLLFRVQHLTTKQSNGILKAHDEYLNVEAMKNHEATKYFVTGLL